jgi:hypothetical protein
VEWTIEFRGDPQDVTITTSGPATLESFLEMNAALLSDPRFRAGMLILVDHSDLDVTPLLQDEVASIGYNIARRGEHFAGTVAAIVCGTREAFGLLRIAQAHAAPSPLRSEVFYDRDEALRWLRMQGREATG